MPFLAFLGFGKTLIQGVVAWLSKLSLADILILALLLVSICEYIVHTADKRHIAKVEAQLAKCTNRNAALDAELKRISTAKNAQKVVTQERIKTVIRTIHDADEAAKKVEAAPPAANCKTKPEVLNADV